jgi:phage N-6-adenine-methyltransferase
MKVNRAFKELIPNLSQEEYAQLEENILQDGIREPISTWNGFVIDGHNRLEIAEKHNLELSYVEYSFESENDVFLWIIKNQLGRRNITAYCRAQLALRLKPVITEKAKENMSVGGKQGLQKSDKPCVTPIDTRQELAEIAGLSHDTISKVEYINKNAEPEIKALVESGNISINQASKAAAFAPEKQKEIAPLLEKGTTVEKLADKPHIAHNSGNNEWYTPSEYIEAARAVMTSIDVDPASSHKANEVVKATLYYTAETDGLTQEWHGNVWLNPPYSSDLIVKFIYKLVEEYNAGHVKQAIVLTNNATETTWFNSLIRIATAVVFPKSRVKFYMPNGETGAPLQGQSVVYIGSNTTEFIHKFSKFGWAAFICAA